MRGNDSLSALMFLAAALSQTAAAAANQKVCPTTYPVVMTINYGDDISTNCKITTVGQIALISFQGTAGDNITIAVTGSWYAGPCADLYDPTNKQLKSGCNNVNAYVASIGFTLTSTGQYTIRVHDSGYTNTGTFGLMLDRWYPTGAASPVTLGQLANGTTVHNETIDDWTFSGTAGEDVIVQVQSSYYAGPCLTLVAPNGQPVAPSGQQSSTLCNNINAYQARSEYILQSAGTYNVTVNSGAYSESGTYSLLVQCVASCTAPAQSQTITFGPLSNQTLGTAPFALTATASSGLPVTLTSNALSVCTVSGSTVTLVATGTCSITASQAGNSTYAAATSVTQTFTVSAATTPSAVYDAAAAFEQGFSAKTNPNGVWSYGYSSGFTGSVTLYTQTVQNGVNGPNAQYWYSPAVNTGTSPAAEFNNGPAYDNGNVDFLANQLILVAGIGGQYSDLVFTAPATGSYSIVCSFRGDQYRIGTVVGVVANGSLVFSSTVTAEGQLVPFNSQVSLVAGQTVIFSVGPGHGLQNTGLSATITGPLSVAPSTPPQELSIYPSAAGAGGAGFTLTVNGSGFVTGSTVQWNSSALTTTYVSGSQLTAAVPASLIANSGAVNVTVMNPGGATSNAVAFTINAATQDPGSTSSLLLVSGTINGTSLAPGNATVTVAPGAAITGSFMVSINSSWPSNDVMAMGVTPTWGQPASSFTDLGGFGTPVSGMQRTITVNLTAPKVAGTYYIIAAYRAEFTAGQVMSCTNWQVGSLNWNTGYAVADWSASTVATANSAGTVLANYLFPAGNTPEYVPATAITIQVGSGAPPAAVGVYRGSNGLFLLNSTFNNTFSATDTVVSFAGSGLTPQATDIPVVGDWSGTGTTKIGLYRPSTGTWYLDYNGNGVFDGPTVDRQYQFGGIGGDIPVTGDWNGSGFSKIGVFRGGFFWVLDTNGDGVFDTGDQTFAFGGATGCTGSLPGFYAAEPAGSCDLPIVGDWNQSGATKVGIVRATAGTSQPFLWILDTAGAQQIILPGTGVSNPSTIFAFGGIAGDLPVVGDWTNTGALKPGIFRSGFFWVEDTTTSLPTLPAANDTLVSFPYGGIAGDIPIVGRWKYTGQ